MPPGMTGDARLVRISASDVDDDAGCPERLAVKARPAVVPATPLRYGRSRYEQFPLGRLMDVLDEHEFKGATLHDALATLVGDESLHPATLRWIRHAAECYVASSADGGDDPLEAVQPYWVAQRPGQRTWELYGWGRRYQSADGSHREFRFLRLGRADDRPRPPGQVAVAAYTTAVGEPANWPRPWREPFRPSTATAASHVRITEVGLLDGSHKVLFDDSAAQAAEYFAEHGRHAIKRLESGGARTPGAQCLDCKQLTGCGSVIRAPHLLAISGRREQPLRTFSISDGRSHAACPVQQHLRSLHLPKLNEYGPEAGRGLAVHAFLEAAHQREPRRCCGPDDLPADPANWTGGDRLLTGDLARGGARMLARHQGVCPYLHHDQITEVQVEPALSYYDTVANVLVIAKPDLLYAEGPAWVWREVKTKERHRWMGEDMLLVYPQLALGVVILAANLLGGDTNQHRIELETLTPASADIELLDVGDPQVVERARLVVSALAEPWHRDEPAVTRPGPDCQMCPVRMWCPDFPGSDDTPPIDTRSANPEV